ncbi:MAG TPA: hypothetical protein EYH05_18005 [Anaerolineae bacterium]|nr:hypothetical protein [Anaerolineae bacterium]
MASIKVIVVDPLGDKTFKVALPDNAPMNQLVPQLLLKLGINKQGSFTLQHQSSGSILAPTDTLQSKNVQEGDKLRVVQAPTAAAQ